MNKKKILTAGGVAVIGFLGILAGYLLSVSPLTSRTASQYEMEQLKRNVSDYVATKLKEEKKNSTLIDIAMLAPTQDSDGAVKFPYTVYFSEPVEGHESTSAVQATAVLRKVANAWRIVKVLTEKETVNYSEDAVVNH